jgi:Prokaryotic lipoprotein-attachment site
MKNNLAVILTLGVGLTLTLAGCGQKTDANSELQRAATELSKTESAPATAPVPEQAAEPSPAAPAPVAASAPPAQQMQQAMVAYKSGQLEDAVTRLQKLRATPTMSPQQRMALNDAMGAVMTEIYGLAAKGDSRAIMAVKQYEKMQTEHH